MPGPLAPYRVLDLSWHYAGPFASKILSDLGAQVIKVERPGGDPVSIVDRREHAGVSASDFYLNGNKRHLTADLRDPVQRDQVLDLALAADVVVEAFRPGVLDRLGLGYEVLRARNSRTILVSVSSFGQTGPYRDFRATDLTLWGMGEVPYISGTPDRPPVKTYGQQASYHAGINAAIGALVALWQRDSGGGQHIDVSVFESVANLIEFSLGLYECLGVIHRRRPKTATSFYPNGIQRTADGAILLAFGSRKGRDVAQALGLPALDDPRFDTNADRRRNREAFDAIFGGWLERQQSDRVLFDLQQKAKLPIAKVNRIDQLFEDLQYRYRQFFIDVEHPTAGILRVPGSPYRLSATPPALRGQGPGAARRGEAGVGEVARARGREEEALTVNPIQPSAFSLQPSMVQPVAPTQNSELRTQNSPQPSTFNLQPSTETQPSAFRLQPSSRPLAGIRVVDLTRFVAGPLVTKQLADLGAQVVKVESIQVPDETRFQRVLPVWPNNDPGPEPWNTTWYFNNQNRNKLSLTLDINSGWGRELLLRLVSLSDIVIENYRPGVLERVGLEYPAFRDANPDIIMLSMSGFGDGGPYRTFGAYGTTVEAMSGLANLNGFPDGDATLTGQPYGDWCSGMWGTVVALAALDHRRRTGQGQRIDLSQAEVVTAMFGEALVDYQLTGKSPPRESNRHPRLAPHGYFPAAGNDEWIGIAVEDDDCWQRFCQAIGQPDLAADSRFATLAGRKKNEDLLDRIVVSWTSMRTKDESFRVLQAHGIAAGPVLNGRDVLFDPQLAARNYFQRVEFPDRRGMAPLIFAANPVIYGDVRPGIDSPAPDLGEHNDQVLGDLLGYSDDERAAMVDAEVIGTRPLADLDFTPTDVAELDRVGALAGHDADYRTRLGLNGHRD